MTTFYVALIGDAIASRDLPPPRRARLQRSLRAALPGFNRRWRKSLAARFAVTQGDELQCLLTHPAPLWQIAHAVRAELALGGGRGPAPGGLVRYTIAHPLRGGPVRRRGGAPEGLRCPSSGCSSPPGPPRGGGRRRTPPAGDGSSCSSRP